MRSSRDQRRRAAGIAAGRFREDLLFRLNTVVIHLPGAAGAAGGHLPARQVLPRAVLNDTGNRRWKGSTGRRVNARMHPGPGNVRELGHAIERAVLMAQGTIITAVDLG